MARLQSRKPRFNARIVDDVFGGHGTSVPAGVGRGAWGVGRGAWGVGRGAWGVGRGRESTVYRLPSTVYRLLSVFRLPSPALAIRVPFWSNSAWLF